MRVVRGNTTYEGSWWSVLKNLWKFKAQDLVPDHELPGEHQALRELTQRPTKTRKDAK